MAESRAWRAVRQPHGDHQHDCRQEETRPTLGQPGALASTAASRPKATPPAHSESLGSRVWSGLRLLSTYADRVDFPP